VALRSLLLMPLLLRLQLHPLGFLLAPFCLHAATSAAIESRTLSSRTSEDR
jgi:hypothetical protein